MTGYRKSHSLSLYIIAQKEYFVNGNYVTNLRNFVHAAQL